VADDAPILLDVTRLIWRRWAGRHPTGIDRVCLAYLNHFGPNAQAVVQHRYLRRILDRGASRALFALLQGPVERFRVALVSGAIRHLLGGDCPGGGRPYLNIGHTGLDSEGFRRWVSASEVRPVYFVHDLIPLSNPEVCRAGEDDRHLLRMQTVLETGAGVIGNSQATLDELRALASQAQLPYPPAIPAWLGVEPMADPQASDGQPTRPTFVTIGTIEARKNHALLLRTWSRLAARLGDDAPRLIIIGQRGWKAQAVFDRLDNDPTLRGHVVELNRCSDEEMARHLMSSRALLFPSIAEGFGLPLVEALALGVPVLASDLPALREVAQGIPKFLAPDDDAGWEEAIIDFASGQSADRERQLRQMGSFHLPSWDEHFQTVEPWLAQIGNGPG